MANDNKDADQIDFKRLREVLRHSEVDRRIKVYQDFRMEAYNYLRQLETSIDGYQLNDIIGIASKFGRLALIFGGNELSKRCVALALQVSNNGFNVSRNDLLDITSEKRLLIKAIDNEVFQLKCRRS